MNVAIPNRPVFRSQDVCEIAEVQPFVLRTWEAEFSDLGVAKAAGGPRLYRRADVERVLQIKHLLFVDGLTIAGVRRRLADERPAVDDEPDDVIKDADVVALANDEARRYLRSVRSGLQWILGVFGGEGAEAGEFVLTPMAGNGTRRQVKKPAKSTGAKVAKKKAAKVSRAKAAPRSAAKKGSRKK
jgi:DNA-binding transcriptional MerR regulator